MKTYLISQLTIAGSMKAASVVGACCFIMGGVTGEAFASPTTSPKKISTSDLQEVSATDLQEVSATNSEETDSIQVSVDLDDIVVEAKKAVVTSDGAKLTYDMDADDTTKGLTALEALKKVPMVTVDGEDKIYIKGSQGFKIYVNGVENPMMTANASTILKNMPVESIAKIEVITEPGAQYDAEGSVGILNIITTRKRSDDGYSATLSGNFGNRAAGANVYGLVKVNKFTADANVNYSHSLWPVSNTNFTETENNAPGNYSLLKQEVSQRFKYQYLGANLNTSWRPNDKNLFTFGASYYGTPVKLFDTNIIARTYNIDNTLQTYLRHSLDGDIHNLGASGNTSYQHNFSDDGHLLTLAYRFDLGKSSTAVNTRNIEEINMPYEYDLQTTDNTNYNRSHTVQIDYINPFGGKHHELMAGGKALFRYNTAYNTYLMGEENQPALSGSYANTKMMQRQNVYAIYASYNYKLNSWNARAGLRYELTDYGIKYAGNPADNFSGKYGDLVPNASISYSLAPAETLRLAYQMRISRPSIENLNPHPQQISAYNVHVGNPDLNSEKAHNISLGYSNYGRVLGGGLTFTASRINNSIEWTSYVVDLIEYNTVVNAGKNSSLRLDGNFMWNITHRMMINLSGGVEYKSIKASFASNHGWGGNYNVNWSYVGPADVKFSAYGGQSLRHISLQGYWTGWYYYGVSINRDFLRSKKLNVNIYAQNFLAPSTRFSSESWNGTSRTKSTSHNKNWGVGVSVSWRFGNTQARVDRTSSDIDNNDTKADNSQGGGGIGK